MKAELKFGVIEVLGFDLYLELIEVKLNNRGTSKQTYLVPIYLLDNQLTPVRVEFIPGYAKHRKLDWEGFKVDLIENNTGYIFLGYEKHYKNGKYLMIPAREYFGNPGCRDLIITEYYSMIELDILGIDTDQVKEVECNTSTEAKYLLYILNVMITNKESISMRDVIFDVVECDLYKKETGEIKLFKTLKGEELKLLFENSPYSIYLFNGIDSHINVTLKYKDYEPYFYLPVNVLKIIQ